MSKKNLPAPVDHVITKGSQASEIFGEVVHVPQGARGQKPKSNGFQTQLTKPSPHVIHLEK